MAIRDEIEDFEDLDVILDKVRVLTMAIEYEDPSEEFKSALCSFAAEVVAHLERLAEKNKPKPTSVPVR